MAEIKVDGYFQILTEVIRVGDRLPFTSFIRLSQNQKVIPFLLINDVVAEERIKKLNSFGHAHLYIKDEEKSAYYNYLNEKITSSDGVEIKNIIQEKINSGNLSGLPTDENGLAQSFLEKLSGQNVGSGAVAAVDDPIVLNGQVDVKSDAEWIQSSLNGVNGEVMTQVKGRIAELEQNLKIRSIADEDLKQWALGAAEKLELEVKKLNSEVTSSKGEMIKVASDIHQKLQDELIKVTGKYGEDTEISRALLKAAQPYYDIYSQYVQGGWPEEKEAQQKALETMRQASERALSSFRIIGGSPEKKAFEQSLENIFRSVEEGLNISLELIPPRLEKANHKFYMQIWMAMTEVRDVLSKEPVDLTKANLILKDTITKLKQTLGEADTDSGAGTGSSGNTIVQPGSGIDPQILEAFKKIVMNQNATIDSLTETLKKLRPESRNIMELWISFQALTKRKLDPPDVMKCEQISKQFQDYDYRFYSEFNKKRRELKSITSELYKILGEDASVIVDNFDFDLTATPTASNQAEAGGPVESQSAEIERLRSENSILSVQIENAQQLARTTVQKNAELEEMLRRSGEYGESLEQEIEKIKKRLNDSLQDSSEVESEKRRLIEGLEEANNSAYRGSVDVESLRQKLAEKEERIRVLEKKEKGFEDGGVSSSVASELEAKENEYRKLERKAEQLKTDYDHLKKESHSHRSKIASLEAEKKDLSKRLEKAVIEKETARQSEKSLDIKITMTNNLLSQARKTISKLTSESEELRQDRLKYIAKTKDIIAEQKALSGRAVTLASQVQAETQKARVLADQVEALKRRELEAQKALQNAQRGVDTLTNENKALKAELQAQLEGSNQVNLEALKIKIIDLEKKIDGLKQENKEISQKFVQEQKKALSLEQELKALKIKTKK
ncbi:MAG: hypothetical protein BroJett040_24830 [Oligoflexia bacterium]|nr:MAG: hypothetical protein BroJett040_24830 [Oligoflexia bacterium]